MSSTEQKPEVLIVDDEPIICKNCKQILIRDGYNVTTANSGKEALAHLKNEYFDIVLTDLKMADIGGAELLETLKMRYPSIVAVVITGYATVASVVEMMKLGAFDYLPKPFTSAELIAVIRKAWEKRQTILDQIAVVEGKSPPGLAGIIGQSRPMQNVYQQIRKVAPTMSNVLIIGESGTGKDLVAKAIHALSPRRTGRFMAVDCGTLSINLLESELFGHLKGAFTGADRAKKGIMEVADGGTVFLDEICNIDMEIQGKLLRFIEEREFIPVGGTEIKRVDIRLIFATNRDLSCMVKEGAFREDLYYRLYVYPITLPPLRERMEDLHLLAYHLLIRIARQNDKKIEGISDEALRLLEEYNWPGNVRELENALEHAVITCDENIIKPHHLPDTIGNEESLDDLDVPKTNEELIDLKKRLRSKVVKNLEKKFVLQALQRNEWNVSRAAREVGMQRQNFQALMKRVGVSSKER